MSFIRQKQALVLVVLIFPVLIFSQDPVFTITPDNLEDIINERGQFVGQVGVVDQPVPAIDFTGDGHIIIRDFSFSQSGFTIESYFYLAGYAESDPYISSITGAWDPDHRGAYVTEGIDFRIGGGYNYPLLPDEAYDGVDDYIRPGANRYTRAKLSKCIGEFVLGTDESPWKEHFTDCCIPLNEWVHMVATWDGEAMRLFVNGRDATDGWRSSGIDIPALYNEKHDLYIGTDNWSTERDFNGHLGYLNIYDEALSLKQIREKYHGSLTEGSCRIIVDIISPRPGEVILPSTKLTFSVSVEGECEIGEFNTDSYTIEISNDPEFTTIVYSTVVSGQDMELSEMLSDIVNEFETAMFIRIIPQNSLGKVRVGKKIGVTSLAVPVIFDTASSVTKSGDRITLPEADYTGGNLLQESSVAVYDLSGRRIEHFRNKKLASSTGIYLVKLPHSSRTVVRFRR